MASPLLGCAGLREGGPSLSASAFVVRQMKSFKYPTQTLSSALTVCVIKPLSRTVNARFEHSSFDDAEILTKFWILKSVLEGWSVRPPRSQTTARHPNDLGSYPSTRPRTALLAYRKAYYFVLYLSLGHVRLGFEATSVSRRPRVYCTGLRKGWHERMV